MNLPGKLVLSSELRIIFDDNVKTTSVSLFIVDFIYLLIYLLFDSFKFKLLYWVIIYIREIKIIIKYIYNTFTVPCEKSKTFSFASSRTKKIIVLFARSKFAVELICWIALGSTSNACCLLKYIAIIL